MPRNPASLEIGKKEREEELPPEPGRQKGGFARLPGFETSSVKGFKDLVNKQNGRKF